MDVFTYGHQRSCRFNLIKLKCHNTWEGITGTIMYLLKRITTAVKSEIHTCKILAIIASTFALASIHGCNFITTFIEVVHHASNLFCEQLVHHYRPLHLAGKRSCILQLTASKL